VVAVPIIWATLGVVILVSAVGARRSAVALQVGLIAVAALFVLAGALVNAAYLARGDDYATFAGGAQLAFVRDTWAALVVPHHHLFIGLLVAFEATVGVLVLLGRRARRLGLAAAIAFHALLVPFGWGFALWSAPMVLALVLLWRAGDEHPEVLASWSALPPARRTLHGS
jgi:hypothetical protein